MATKLKIPIGAKVKKYFQDKMACTTGLVEKERWVKQGKLVNIVDVRASEDYAEGHIPGAVNLPKAQWHDAKIVKTRLNKKKINVLYCYSKSATPRPRRQSSSSREAIRPWSSDLAPKIGAKFGSNGFRATHAPLLCRNWGIAIA
jgi:Rhodanese-like domain